MVWLVGQKSGATMIVFLGCAEVCGGEGGWVEWSCVNGPCAAHA